MESTDNPRLIAFRDRHRPDEAVRGEPDEFSKMVALCRWAYRRFPRLAKPTYETEDALEILEKVAEGHAFYCSHYAIVFTVAATALGWHARPISLRRADHPERVSNHNVAEAWSTQYEKWVAFDPTLKHYIECDGVPLNCYEIGREWHRNGGRHMEFVVGPERERYRRADLPVVLAHHEGFGDLAIKVPWTDAYACVAYIPTNCFLGAFSGRSMERWDDWPDLLVLEGRTHGWELDAEVHAPYYRP